MTKPKCQLLIKFSGLLLLCWGFTFYCKDTPPPQQEKVRSESSYPYGRKAENYIEESQAGLFKEVETKVVKNSGKKYFCTNTVREENLFISSTAELEFSYYIYPSALWGADICGNVFMNFYSDSMAESEYDGESYKCYTIEEPDADYDCASGESRSSLSDISDFEVTPEDLGFTRVLNTELKSLSGREVLCPPNTNRSVYLDSSSRMNYGGCYLPEGIYSESWISNLQKRVKVICPTYMKEKVNFPSSLLGRFLTSHLVVI